MFVEEYKEGDKWLLVYAASIAILVKFKIIIMMV